MVNALTQISAWRRDATSATHESIRIGVFSAPTSHNDLIHPFAAQFDDARCTRIEVWRGAAQRRPGGLATH
jgi:hypothetical protein